MAETRLELPSSIHACLFDLNGALTETMTFHAQAAVFEEALAGVVAGHTGWFGFVVSADRVGQASEFRRLGDDSVVTDFAVLMEAT